MSSSQTSPPLAYCVRHGETAWSRSGQHTGRTDLQLTADGEVAAKALGVRLKELNFTHVFSSPLIRAWNTCQLAGFGTVAERDPDLMEWDYGQYEGLKTVDIKSQNPKWDLFREGTPGGETPKDVAARVDRVIAKVRAAKGNVLLFSSGHLLRVLASRWLGQDVSFARFLLLGTGTISVLGYDHNDVKEPAIKHWNT